MNSYVHFYILPIWRTADSLQRTLGFFTEVNFNFSFSVNEWLFGTVVSTHPDLSSMNCRKKHDHWQFFGNRVNPNWLIRNTLIVQPKPCILLFQTPRLPECFNFFTFCSLIKCFKFNYLNRKPCFLGENIGSPEGGPDDSSVFRRYFTESNSFTNLCSTI